MGAPRIMSEDDRAVFAAIAAAIEKASTIAISGHTNPDGDALGSTLGLTYLIEGRWPGKQVQPLYADDRISAGSLGFLPGFSRLMPACSYTGAPDLFIGVDTPNTDRLAGSRAVLERAGDSAAFDHHISMEPYARTNLKRDDAPACADIVCDFASFLGATPSVEAATCLLTGIITDTGRFQYQNTTDHALNAAAWMVELGASPSRICTAVYQSDSRAALELRALALSRLALDVSGQVAYSYITLADMEGLGARNDDCDHLIDDIRCLGAVSACVMFRETAKGCVRANLRSKVDGLNVSQVAAQFGGGGHLAAAGLTYKGTLKEAMGRVVEAVAHACKDLPQTETAS